VDINVRGSGDVSVSFARSTPLGIGAFAGLVPFIIHVSTWSSVTANGRVVSSTYRDYVALGCGIIAAVFGVIAIVQARRSSLMRGKAIVLGIAVTLLGGFQIARGLGVFETRAGSVESGTEPDSITAQPVAAEVTPAAPITPDTCPDAHACNELGKQLAKADPVGSRTAYLHGCNSDGRGNCFNAALAFRDGPEGSRKPEAAVELFDKACKLGMVLSCSNLGAMLLDGDVGVPKDQARATKLFEDACSTDDGLGCSNLGVVYRDALGVKADRARALQLFLKACDHDWSGGCDNAGIALYSGDGVPADKKRAVELFEKACASSDEPRCYDLGVMYDEGKIVKQDYPRARELYEKACGLDDRRACNNLGILLLDGKGGPVDRDRARALYAKACDSGLKLGCKNRDDLDKPTKPAKPARSRRKD
jgi:TPR repeat protein